MNKYALMKHKLVGSSAFDQPQASYIREKQLNISEIEKAEKALICDGHHLKVYYLTI